MGDLEAAGASRTRSDPSALSMSEKNSASKAREALLPDIVKALSDVSMFIAQTAEEADASRQRKPVAPSVECVEEYCAAERKKTDLLMAEAALMRVAEKAGTKPKAKDQKVRWTDIDGNTATDAAWLK